MNKSMKCVIFHRNKFISIHDNSTNFHGFFKNLQNFQIIQKVMTTTTHCKYDKQLFLNLKRSLNKNANVF